VWGLGYASSPNQSDDDHAETEEDNEEARNTVEVQEMIWKGESVTDKLVDIYNSTRLRDVYNYRWWSP
jgi:hypothetical protein